MENRRISILLPSAYRAQQLRRAVELIREAPPLPVEILVSVIEDDRMSQAAIRDMHMLRHIRTVDEYNGPHPAGLYKRVTNREYRGYLFRPAP